jgi:hypothetical protein
MPGMDWKAGILFVISSLIAWMLTWPRVAYYFDAYMRLFLISLAILSALIGLLGFVGIAQIEWYSNGNNAVGSP